MKKSIKYLAVPFALLLALTSCASDNLDGNDGGVDGTNDGSTDEFQSAQCDDYASTVFETSLTVCASHGEIVGLSFAPIAEHPEETRTEILEQGTGEDIDPEKVYYLTFAAYNAQTGEALFNKATNAGYSPAMMISPSWEGEYPEWLLEPLVDNPVGTRYAVEVTQDAEEGEIPGISAGENILWVFEVKQELKFVADGEEQKQSGDLPMVSVDEDGYPSITIPQGEPSPELQLEVLKKGSGDVVPNTAEVWIQYQGTNWRTGEIFDETWVTGTPTSFKLDGVVKGFSEAIAGQTVGSQIIVTVPPEYGYGAKGNPGADIKGTDTIIFVIDILASISGE